MQNRKKQFVNEINLDSMDLRRRSFWGDVNEVKKKMIKKQLRRQNINEVCYHDMKTKTKH